MKADICAKNLTKWLKFTLIFSAPLLPAATLNCPANGYTLTPGIVVIADATNCIQASIKAAQLLGDSQLFLGHGTFVVSNTLIVPTKFSIIGAGRGDFGGVGTTIRASASFPVGQSLVEMGTPGNLNYGVRISNLTLDGNYRAGVALHNSWSMEQSYGSDLLLVSFLSGGLVVDGSGAQNSGPFRDLEIYSSAPTAACIVVRNGVSAFRGVQDVTCNAQGAATLPAVALRLDGAGQYEGIHVEHYETAVKLGNSAPADGLTFIGLNAGPDVQIGVLIGAGTSQNLTLQGLQCSGCQYVLKDEITNRSTGADVGFYMLGNGAGSGKRVITSDISMADNALN